MTQTKTCGECGGFSQSDAFKERGYCNRMQPPANYQRTGIAVLDLPMVPKGYWCLSFIPKDSGEGGE